MMDAVLKTAKKVLFAGIGFLDNTVNSIENFTDELVERGELRRKDSGDFITEILERMKVERDEFGEVLRDILRDVFGTIGIATAHDLQEMMDRVTILEKKAASLRRRTAKAPRKKERKKK